MGHPFTSIASPASGWPNYGKRSQSGEIPDRRGDVSLSTHDPARLLVINIDGLAGFYWDDPAARMPTLRGLADSQHQRPPAAVAPSVAPSTVTSLPDSAAACPGSRC